MITERCPTPCCQESGKYHHCGARYAMQYIQIYCGVGYAMQFFQTHCGNRYALQYIQILSSSISSMWQRYFNNRMVKKNIQRNSLKEFT